MLEESGLSLRDILLEEEQVAIDLSLDHGGLLEVRPGQLLGVSPDRDRFDPTMLHLTLYVWGRDRSRERSRLTQQIGELLEQANKARKIGSGSRVGWYYDESFMGQVPLAVAPSR